MKTLSTTPRADGFRMPGEFEPHAGSWITWPTRPDVWRENAGPVQRTIVDVARAIARFEPVTVCAPGEQWQKARTMLSPQVRVVEMSSNDAWMRDHAPTFVIDGNHHVRGVDWIFNGYGGPGQSAYRPYDLDDQIAPKILEIERIDRYKSEMVLEGGSIHVDGQGTLITTEECLLNPNRNPGMSKADIETTLKQYLGVDRVIWLKMGVLGDDDNSGHVDDLCAFVHPGVVVLTWTDDKQDPQYERSRAAYELLRATVDARGRQFVIHKIHQPEPAFFTQEEVEGIAITEDAVQRQVGQRIGASYVNFYIANGAVFVPGFGGKRDEEAVVLLRMLFRGREVIQLETREILLGVGNIHCVVMQQPSG